MSHPALASVGATVIARILVRLEVQGRERIPPGPVVAVCNHRSWIDPPLILSVFGRKRRVVFLAAREHVEKRRVLDALLRWLGVVILVDRSSVHQRDTLREANETLLAGGDLALFPEGKVNFTDEPLLALEPGTALIARRASVPIVPLGIAGTRELHFRRQVILAVGMPLSPGASRKDDDDVTERLRTALLDVAPQTPALSRRQPGAWLRRLT